MVTCNKCVLDDSIGEINFDSEGVCNYCHLHDEMEKQYPVGKKGEKILNKLCDEIKSAGKGNYYDCIVGASGGTDSSYILHLMAKQGLRCLAVHYDNGWNTETAFENMRKVCDKLEIPLKIITPDTELFNKICKTFLLADVSDADVINDIALATVLYQAAETYNVDYIINGHSFRTEGTAPTGLTYMDAKYIESVYKEFTGDTLVGKDYPNMWLEKWLEWMLIHRIKRVRPLYYVDYDKDKVKELLVKEYGWTDYGKSHGENEYTMFISNYYQPLKFNIDLMKVIYSGQVRSGFMTRDFALNELAGCHELDDKILAKVKSRLNISDADLDIIMHKPRRSYTEFSTYLPLFKALEPVFKKAVKENLMPKTFYEKYCK